MREGGAIPAPKLHRGAPARDCAALRVGLNDGNRRTLKLHRRPPASREGQGASATTAPARTRTRPQTLPASREGQGAPAPTALAAPRKINFFLEIY